MALREITEFPERVLKDVGEPVEKFDEDLEKLVADMFETMYAEEGVGLAAPQVGLSLRLFVMDCEGIKLVAANPEILSALAKFYAARGDNAQAERYRDQLRALAGSR